MKNTILLIMLIASAMAAITISPTTPVKVGDSITWVENISVNVTRYSVFLNTTNQTTCYSVEPTLSEMLCSEMDNKDAMAHLDVEDTHISEPIICQKTYSNETLLQGVNITESNPNTNTTVVHQTYTCAHTFEHTISNAHPDASVPYSTYLSSTPENESNSGNITIQSVNLTVNPIPTDTDNSFEVSGSFLWSDGTPLVDKPVDISSELCTGLHSTTDSKGRYSAICDYDAYTISDSYPVSITAKYSLQDSYNTNTTVSTKGETQIKFEISRDKIQSNPNGGAELQYVWEVEKGTDINHVVISAELNSTNQTFSRECPGVSGEKFTECDGSFLAVAPEEWGNYTFTITAIWDDARGVHHTEHRRGVLSVNKESTYTLDKPSLLADIPVGGETVTTIKLTSSGNVNTTINVSNDWFVAVVDDKGNEIKSIVLPKTGDKSIKIRARLPYDTNSIKKGEVPFINEFGMTRMLEYTLTPKIPSMVWDQSKVVLNATSANVTLTNVLHDTGSTAHNVSISVDCPDLWLCSVTPKQLGELGGGKSTSILVHMSLAYIDDNPNKTIDISATDAAGRIAKFQVVLQMDSKNTIAVGEPVLTSTLYADDIRDRQLFFVDDGKLVERSRVDVSGISPRVRRESTLSSWVVSSMNDSKGLGDVCDVYVVAGNKSYLIDPDPGVITTLVGGKGEPAYEYIVPHKVGECKAHLAYKNVKTLTYVDITSGKAESTLPMTSAEIQNIIDESARKSTSPLSTAIYYLAIILAAVAGVYAYYVLVFKRKGVDLPKRKSKQVFVVGNIRGLTERGREAQGTITQKIDNLFKTKKQKEEELEGKPFGKFFLKLNEISEGDPKWD